MIIEATFDNGSTFGRFPGLRSTLEVHASIVVTLRRIKHNDFQLK